MTKSITASTAFALALMGCAGPKAYRSFDVTASSEVHISVQVIADEYIIVNQEPAYVKQGNDNTIFWHLNPAGLYYFPNTGSHKGITFTPPPQVPPGHTCSRDASDPKTYVCKYLRAAKGKFLYAIEVTKDDTNYLKSDPTVMNN